MTKIPIIDLAPFLYGSGTAPQKVVQEIYGACQEVGVFYLKNHGISQKLIDPQRQELGDRLGCPFIQLPPVIILNI